MTKKLFITVGISKSGKSTWCHSVIDKLENTELISLDEIKKYGPQKPSYLIAFKWIKNYLRHGNVLFDANNCKYEHRLALLDMIKNIDCEKYVVKFDVSLEASIKRIEPGSYMTEAILSRQYSEFAHDIDKLNEFRVLSKFEFENLFCNVKNT